MLNGIAQETNLEIIHKKKRKKNVINCFYLIGIGQAHLKNYYYDSVKATFTDMDVVSSQCTPVRFFLLF